MKHTKKKRILALVLCMVLVLSTGIAAFANENVGLQSVACSATNLERVIKNADGEQIGTLTADIPEGAFFASSSDANIQMEVEPDSGEAGVLNRVQQQMETEGVTGYEISNYVMGDVTFYVNGEKQTPQQPITFHVSGTNIDTQNVMAFADDRQNAPTLMDATTDENGGLQFTAQTSNAETVVYGIYDVTTAETDETTDDAAVQTADDGVAVQAAGYSITTSATNGVDITVQHYLNGKEDAPLYKESTIHLSNSEKITNLSSLTNYQAVKVVEVNDGVAASDSISGNIILNKDQTYRVYYQATTERITQKPVQMFDYTIGSMNGGINSDVNYGTNIPKTSRLASGTTKQDNCNDYDTSVAVSGKEPYYINTWNYISDGKTLVNVETINGKTHVYGSNTDGTAFAAKGIITGIDYDSGALKMGKTSSGSQLYEPGYFSKETKIGKNIYLDDYKLTFDRNGDTYTLYDVTNASGTTQLSNYNRDSGANFFPLDGLGTSDAKNTTSTSDKKKHNDYFGMRYDVEFTLGDYLGNLNYEFKGDDDLWVVLDAEKNGGEVVLDIGGIHAAIPGTVDLWTKLLDQEIYTLQDKINYLEGDDDHNGIKNKDEKHTLTILYMERGANESNCKMNFTLPNSKVIDTGKLDTSSLKLTKVNTSGTVISGAEFEVVNDSNSNDKQTVTSGTDGKLIFTGLKEGSIYTLREVSVPSPYVATTTEWKIKLEGSPLKAVLYDSTGNTAQTLDNDGTYHIVNSTQDDIVSKSVESNKTVSVKDYDNRIYQVDLTASSKATQTVTKTVPYDIVLVLDRSGSMNYDFYNYTVYNGTLQSGNKRNVEYFVKTDDKIYQELEYHSGYVWNDSSYWFYRDADSNEVKVTQGTTTIYTRSESGKKMAALKTAAKAFVDNVNVKNPDSRISVVSFGYTNETEIKESNGKYLLRVGDSKQTINNWIDNITPNGATDTATGFSKANTVFSSSNKWADVQQPDGRKKMVVFLTDGVPTTSNTYNSDVAGDAVDYATTIKTTYGADIYSLGIFDAADSSGELSGAPIATINQFMKNIASDSSKYMTADSIDSLYNIFNSITDNLDVSVTATITDVIDSRFELTADQKKAFEARNDVQVTYNPDGTTTVTWTNTTVNSKNGDTPGWHETIEIKAKDDFIGGNMIPTNGPASGITVGDNTKLFPQPSVNVKLLTPSIGNKEKTYYKGDTIESSKFSGELLGTYEITELDGTTKLTAGKGIPQLTEDQLETLKNGGKVEIPYSYTNSSTDIEGTFVYEYKNTKYEAEGTEVDPLKDHTATKVGQDVEEYELTVTFVPKTVAERKDLLKDTAVLEPNTDASISGTVVNSDNMKVTGTYKVHVLALWAIVKQSTSTGSDGKHPMLSGAEFELLKDSKVCYTGKSNDDGFVEWYKDKKKVSLSEIEKGTYTLRETSAPAGYAKSEAQWTIEITDTLVTIRDAAGKNITATELENGGKTYDTYAYENTPVYELPSTGGKGIFLYTIGGMLLMGAAAWILYKNKCREVLKR